MDGTLLGLAAATYGGIMRISQLLSASSVSSMVNLTNATQDYELQPYEIAYISFSNATTVPLRIATPNNSYYELHLIPSDTGRTKCDIRTSQNCDAGWDVLRDAYHSS